MGEIFDSIKQIGTLFILGIFLGFIVNRIVIRMLMYFFPNCLSCKDKNFKIEPYQCDAPETQ